MSNYIENRPWGSFEILLDEGVKVKRIIVNPGQRLSYQSHNFRNEFWVITEGEADVTLNDDVINYKVNQVVEIPRLMKHRVQNNGKEKLVFIEVQTGTYFGEDDIIRLEDDYMRSDEVKEFLEFVDKSGPWPEEDDKIFTIGGLSNDKEGSFMKYQKKINKNE